MNIQDIKCFLGFHSKWKKVGDSFMIPENACTHGVFYYDKTIHWKKKDGTWDKRYKINK